MYFDRSWVVMCHTGDLTPKGRAACQLRAEFFPGLAAQ